MWNCEGGKIQTAYRIAAESEGKTLWDSGKVKSDDMRAEYPSEPVSRMRAEWKVMLWDENDKPGEWSEKAYFETGLLKASDWKADWIACNYRVRRSRRYPVDCFRKTFTAKKVCKARLYATACGFYEVCINGKKAGDFVLAPGHTDYCKSIQYQTYDVTELINEGRIPLRRSLRTVGTVAVAEPGEEEINTAYRRSCCFSWSFTERTEA